MKKTICVFPLKVLDQQIGARSQISLRTAVREEAVRARQGVEQFSCTKKFNSK
ncbi:unnamed protein product, partial [Timema podura]|nr:unnamed protein product [Timema podura]